MDALDSVVAPLRPTLQSITHALPAPVQEFGLSLLGDTCYNSLVIHLDLSSSNQECFSLAISKALGIAIVGASAVVKIPQLLTLVQSQSAEGLSFLSYLLETTSFVITLAYNVRNGFPFSTFGETAFIAVQNIAIAVLILVYSGQQPAAAAFVAGLSAAGYALFGPGEVVDMEMLKYLQMGAGLLGVAAKLPQIVANYRQGSTGQLSAFAVCWLPLANPATRLTRATQVINYLAGSMARIFTTLKEVDDTLILGGFLAGAFFNAILFAQLIYYWNVPAAGKAAKARHPRRTTSLSADSTTTGVSKTKAPTTRRRG